MLRAVPQNKSITFKSYEIGDQKNMPTKKRPTEGGISLALVLGQVGFSAVPHTCYEMTVLYGNNEPVQLVDISLVVLSIVEVECLLANVGDQGIFGVWEWLQHIWG
jgi:hypothetical protein